jgi:hypothetical protein
MKCRMKRGKELADVLSAHRDRKEALEIRGPDLLNWKIGEDFI